jgi:acetyltransferase-like isoleucine patch superfamily enzyme
MARDEHGLVPASDQAVGELADDALGPAAHLGPETWVQQGDAHADIFRPMLARRLLGRLRRTRGEIAEARSLRVWLLYLPGPGPWLMSWLRKRWVIFRNPTAHIEFRGPVYLGPRFSLHMPRGGTFIVGPGVEFRRGFRAELGPTARIEIGGGSVFTYDVLMQCDTSIDIGERVMFGQCTMVVDGNHRYRDLTRPMLHQGYDYRPLRIADDVTITTKCTIIANIGTRAVIGANSVVTRDIPSYCVAGGTPARVLDYFGPPGEEPAEIVARSASSASTSG